MIYDTIEKAKDGYTQAELKFYKALNILPITLAECSFYNLSKYDYEVGDDCCEYIDYTLENDKCPDFCNKQEEKYACYPAIMDSFYAYYAYIISKYNVTIKANNYKEYLQLILSTIAILINENRLSDEDLDNIKSTVGHYTF